MFRDLVLESREAQGRVLALPNVNPGNVKSRNSTSQAKIHRSMTSHPSFRQTKFNQLSVHKKKESSMKCTTNQPTPFRLKTCENQVYLGSKVEGGTGVAPNEVAFHPFPTKDSIEFVRVF